MRQRVAGDTHLAIFKGSQARVEIRQGAEEKYLPELYLVPEGRDLESLARETFAAHRKKWIRVQVAQRYKLADAAQAHRDLEARRTTGSSILLP